VFSSRNNFIAKLILQTVMLSTTNRIIIIYSHLSKYNDMLSFCANFLGTGRITEEVEGTLVVGSGAASTPVIGPLIKLRKFSFRLYISSKENMYLMLGSGIWCLVFFLGNVGIIFKVLVMNQPLTMRRKELWVTKPAAA
jgi:hypothetical protein